MNVPITEPTNYVSIGDRGSIGRYLHPVERILIIALAAVVFYLRMPDLFKNPQFWGEDVVFYSQAIQMGMRSFVEPVSGYLLAIPRVPSLLAEKLPPVFAPTVFTYASIALTLLVVWLATSPRFMAPLRPVLALAVVVVPAGVEVLGTITNVQWIMPVGVLILMFSEPPRSRMVLSLELLFVTAVMLTGPFCLFFVPILLWQAYANRNDPAKRTRLLVFLSAAIFGAAVQIGYIYANRHLSVGTPGLAADYSRSLWLTLPFRQMLWSLGWHGLGVHVITESLLASAAMACIIFLSFRQPFRDLKLAVLALAVAIAISGMWKYRAVLPSAGYRYFYVPSIAVIWIACCSVPRSRLLAMIAGAVLALEAAMAVSGINTPRITEDLEWRANSSFISNGLFAHIPTSPPGWMLALQPLPDRPMSDLLAWGGKPIAAATKIRDGAACEGSIASVEPTGILVRKKLWQVRGDVVEQVHPVRAIVLVNDDNIIVGTALTGFKTAAPDRLGWASVIAAEPGTLVRAYTISSQDNEACKIPGEHVVPAK